MEAKISIVDRIESIKTTSPIVPRPQIPQNIEAEQVVLGALLYNNAALDKVLDILLPEHFYIPIHAKIYQVIQTLVLGSSPATPITMKAYLAADLASSGNDYLVKLVADADLIVDVKPFAKIIYDCYLRRELLRICEDTVSDTYNTELHKSAKEILENTEQLLCNIAVKGSSETTLASLRKPFFNTLHCIESIKSGKSTMSGVMTNFVEMDKITGGLQPSDLIIIAARPSMGKTALALSIALNIATNFKKVEKKADKKPPAVAMFSLEMSSDQIAKRLLAIDSKIETGRIRSGQVTNEEFARLSKAAARQDALPLFIDDAATLTVPAMKVKLRKLQRQYQIGLVVVDYLQLIQPTTNNYNSNRTQEIGEISQALKALAKEFNVPVVALSQLSRAAEKRDDKRPQLADLRDSGNIEQDADIVMFLYRKEYYMRRNTSVDGQQSKAWQEEMEDVKNTAEIIVSKQRNGPIGTFILGFDNATTTFKNLF